MLLALILCAGLGYRLVHDTDFVHEPGEAFILSGAAINEAFEPTRKGIYSQTLKILPTALFQLKFKFKLSYSKP